MEKILSKKTKAERKEEILELKKTAEDAVKLFKHCVDQLNTLGFMVKVQSDNSVYVFRDVRESYGKLIDNVPVVTKEPVHGPQVVNGKGQKNLQ